MNSSHHENTPHDLLEEVELLDMPGGDEVRLCFDGPFEGKKVRWNATLFTPEGWVRRFGEQRPEQNIIDIHQGADNEWVLKVCLKVACIDRPTIRKAVMMMRRYRRLRRGRHLYG